VLRSHGRAASTERQHYKHGSSDKLPVLDHFRFIPTHGEARRGGVCRKCVSFC